MNYKSLAEYIYDGLKNAYLNPSNDNNKEALKRLKIMVDNGKFNHNLLLELSKYNIRPTWKNVYNGLNKTTYIGIVYRDKVFQLE